MPKTFCFSILFFLSEVEGNSPGFELDSERFNFALSADGLRAYYTTSVFRFQSVVGYLGPECLIPAVYGALQPREQI